MVLVTKWLHQGCFTWPQIRDGVVHLSATPARDATRSPMLIPLLVRLTDSEVEAGDCVFAQATAKDGRRVLEETSSAGPPIHQESLLPDLHIDPVHGDVRRRVRARLVNQGHETIWWSAH
jgi:hypothetical protein